MSLSSARALVLDLLTAPAASHFAPAVRAFLPAPLSACEGVETLFETFFKPLARSFGGAALQPELLAAERGDTGTVWVAVMASVQADQGAPFLAVPPGKDRRLRLGLFLQVEAGGTRQDPGRVLEIRVLFDLLDLAAQAGFALLPAYEGRKTLPRPGDQPGLHLNAEGAPDAASRGARALVSGLIGGLNQLDRGALQSMPQRDFWADDMGWYGPWGIGGAEGFDEYQRFAQGPSVASFPNRRGTWPKDAFVAEGAVAAFTGWPSMVGDFTGAPFRGIAPTGGRIEQRIMDFYLVRGDRLWRNWVFIDLIDFAAQCGVDLLTPLRAQTGGEQEP